MKKTWRRSLLERAREKIRRRRTTLLDSRLLFQSTNAVELLNLANPELQEIIKLLRLRFWSSRKGVCCCRAKWYRKMFLKDFLRKRCRWLLLMIRSNQKRAISLLSGEREIERESSFVCCLHHRRGLCVRESEIELARGENPEWRTVCCSELSGDDKLWSSTLGEKYKFSLSTNRISRKYETTQIVVLVCFLLRCECVGPTGHVVRL